MDCKTFNYLTKFYININSLLIQKYGNLTVLTNLFFPFSDHLNFLIKSCFFTLFSTLINSAVIYNSNKNQFLCTF